MTNEELRNAMTDYGDTVYRLALCRLQNTHDAEDVFQDVFLRLFRQETTDWEAERTKAWLIRTTLNRCADAGRFRLRHKMVPLDAVSELAAPEQEESTLWEAVSSLPGEFRIVVHLHYGEGYSTEEIAQILHCRPATVRTRLHRARKKLKDLLEGFDDEA